MAKKVTCCRNTKGKFVKGHKPSCHRPTCASGKPVKKKK